VKSEYSGAALDHLRRICSTQRTEIANLRLDLAREKFRRLTLEIESAIAANDGVSWARAVGERSCLGLAEHEVADLWPVRESA
jgi:hypothetical protein